MKRHSDKPHSGKSGSGPTGPSQRQLRAGELIRHALVDILREEELQDEALTGVTITVSEVRMSPDLRHAVCFVEPLGAGLAGQAAGQNVDEIIKGLNRVSKFLRGRLGRSIDMKFTPDLKFLHDESFGTAAYMDKLFLDPRVRQDTERRLSDVLDDEGGDED
jgi:ribosome-binding factor A